MAIAAIAAPTALPMMRIAPRDSAAAREVRVTIQAEIATHQGSSECSTNAANTASAATALPPSRNAMGSTKLERAEFSAQRAGQFAQHRQLLAWPLAVIKPITAL